MKKIIKTEWKKVLATLLVSAFFIFFWINGPLQFVEVLSNLESEITKFSNPKIVGEKSKIESFGEIEDVVTKGEGWELILDNPKKNETDFKIISSEVKEIIFSPEYAAKLENHVHKIIEGSIITQIQSTEEFTYIKISKDNRNYFYTESGAIFNHIRGYGGPINIGILINDLGEIEKVQHVSSKETESYLKKIVNSGFYQSFERIPIEEKHVIDAVSGATLTTEAIAKISNELVSLVADSYSDYLLEDRNSLSFEIIAKNNILWVFHIIVIAIMFLYGIQKKYKKSKKGIRILAIASVLYIGFFMNNSFTYVSFLHPFLGTVVSPLIAFYALFSLLGAIWGKNTYCKYVCPFGHAQRLGLQLSKKRFAKKFFIKNKWVKLIRSGTTIILISGILLGLRFWGNFEIFPDFFGGDFVSIWFFISASLVLINLKYPFIWCRIACPTGSVLDTIAKISN